MVVHGVSTIVEKEMVLFGDWKRAQERNRFPIALLRWLEGTGIYVGEGGVVFTGGLGLGRGDGTWDGNVMSDEEFAGCEWEGVLVRC